MQAVLTHYGLVEKRGSAGIGGGVGAGLGALAGLGAGHLYARYQGDAENASRYRLGGALVGGALGGGIGAGLGHYIASRPNAQNFSAKTSPSPVAQHATPPPAVKPVSEAVAPSGLEDAARSVGLHEPHGEVEHRVFSDAQAEGLFNFTQSLSSRDPEFLQTMNDYVNWMAHSTKSPSEAPHPDSEYVQNLLKRMFE